MGFQQIPIPQKRSCRNCAEAKGPSRLDPIPDEPSPQEKALDADLLKAHRIHDAAALARLYADAAQMSEQAGRVEEACYRRTQAYVFALESGATALAASLRQKLIAAGREE